MKRKEEGFEVLAPGGGGTVQVKGASCVPRQYQELWLIWDPFGDDEVHALRIDDNAYIIFHINSVSDVRLETPHRCCRMRYNVDERTVLRPDSRYCLPFFSPHVRISKSHGHAGSSQASDTNPFLYLPKMFQPAVDSSLSFIALSYLL